jgi:hypothetical protein
VTARVVHVERRAGDRAWGATAIHPAGSWPRALVQYPAAYAGEGAELTGLQVLDEFEALSGPIVLAPASDLGLVYDALLTGAFERDETLSLGSGWPPIVVGVDVAGSDTVAVTAEDLAPLTRDPDSEGAPVGAHGAGLGGGGFGAAFLKEAGARVDAFVLGAGVAAVLAEARLESRALRALARAALAGLAAEGCVRTLALAAPSELAVAELVRRAMKARRT